MDSPATRHQDTAGGRRRRSAAVEFARVVRAAHPEQVGHLRHEARRWLTDLGLPEDEQESVLLAVNEAVENAVEHAYADEDEGVVELTLWAEPGVVNVAVVDHGRWREPGEDDPATAARAAEADPAADPAVTDVDSFADAYADATAGPGAPAEEAPASGEESAVGTHGARGRGIVLMHRSVDSVAIRHDAAGTAVLLRHHRQG